VKQKVTPAVAVIVIIVLLAVLFAAWKLTYGKSSSEKGEGDRASEMLGKPGPKAAGTGETSSQAQPPARPPGAQ
jgi:hypothetical protein